MNGFIINAVISVALVVAALAVMAVVLAFATRKGRGRGSGRKKVLMGILGPGSNPISAMHKDDAMPLILDQNSDNGGDGSDKSGGDRCGGSL